MWSDVKALVENILGTAGYDFLAERYWEFLELVSLPLNSHSRFFWVYILGFLAVTACLYVTSANAGERRSLRGYFRSTFPKEIYWHRSARLDYLIFMIGAVLSPIGLVFRGVGATSAALAVHAVLVSQFGATADPMAPGWLALGLLTVATLLVDDLVTYTNHYLHHRVPFLWELHKLHHSAEVMTPVTVYRVHPLYSLNRHLVLIAIYGTFQGIVTYTFALDIEVYTLFGVNGLLVLFHGLSNNLRHSHIWHSYGPIVNRIIISPAQHQIHHSTAPEHLNKNFGFMFAFWDWIFGTLYVPEGKESLTFGLGDGKPHPHDSLLKAYMVPVTGAGKRLYRSIARLGRFVPSPKPQNR